MRGPDAGAVVAVEILVEQQIVAPVRIGLEFLRPAEHRSATILPSSKEAAQTPGDLLADFKQGHLHARSGRALDRECVAVVQIKLSQRADQQRVDRHPDRPAPIGVAAKYPGAGFGGLVFHPVFRATRAEYIGLVAVSARQGPYAMLAEELVGIEHTGQHAPKLLFVD